MNQDAEVLPRSPSISPEFTYLEGTTNETPSHARLSKPAIVFLIGLYIILTLLTREVFQGDTPYYISSILDHSGTRDFAFWDFGHLMWRPANWVLLQVIHGFFPSANSASVLFSIMVVLNWMAGLGCVLLVARVARRFASSSLAILASATLAVSQVFLNYLHTGTAYVPGLFFLLLGLDFVSSHSRKNAWRESIGAGISLAVAVLLWFPYVFALPAAFLFPIIHSGFKKQNFHFTVRTLIVSSVIGFGAYGLVAAKLRLRSTADLQLWFTAASHSIDHIGGLPRAAFGFVRSWIEMGNVGTEFRRFLLHDPYAPVSLISLIFVGTWKLLLTYLLLGAIGFKLLVGSGQERRMLLFLMCAFVPVFSFGIKWQGGDMERYLGAFPALLLAGAFAMKARPPAILKVLGIAFLGSLIVVNLPTDLRWVRDAQERGMMARLDALGTIPENSYIVFFPADPLAGFISSGSVIHPPRSLSLSTGWVITIGSSHVKKWQRDFASRSLNAWKNGREVWICRGLLDKVPENRWGWVEGAEPSVPWKDIHAFFSQVETSELRGDFVQVPPTRDNIRLLERMVPPSE